MTTVERRPACVDKNPELFYPDTSDHRCVQVARAVCAQCPVQLACLQRALEDEGTLAVQHRFGVWGGTTPEERGRLAGHGRTIIRASCGTAKGIRSHYKHHEKPCDDCRAAASTKRAANKPAAECGTDSGYYRHKRTTKTPVCDACREAHTAAQRSRKGEAATERFDALHLLVDNGAGIETAMQRLGVTRDALWRWCKRNGASHLYDLLVERDEQGRVA